MAQSNVLLRFRARLRTRGYQDIRISKAFTLQGVRAYDERGDELWLVKCVEPLLGYEACFVASEKQMDNWPGIVLDRNGIMTKQMEFEEGDGIFV